MTNGLGLLPLVVISAMIASADIAHADAGPDGCVRGFLRASEQEQASCLHALAHPARAALDSALPWIREALASSDGSTDHKLIATLLDALRSLGPKAASAGTTLSSMLAHRHPIYRDRDKSVVTRLRTHIFVTLSEIGTPSSAIPALLDVLAHFDVRNNPAETGAAVRAAGALGADGRVFVPYLLAMLTEPVSAEEFSLVAYEPRFDKHDATTIQLEVVRSLGKVCAPDDREAIAALHQLAKPGTEPGADRRLEPEAQNAIDRIERRRQ